MVVASAGESAVLLVAGVALVVLAAGGLADALTTPGHSASARRRAPQRTPYAAAAARRSRRSADRLALGLRSRDFCLLAGSFFICGLSTNGLIGTHLIPASMEHGIPEVMAASCSPPSVCWTITDHRLGLALGTVGTNRYLLCLEFGLGDFSTVPALGCRFSRARAVSYRPSLGLAPSVD